MSALALPSQRVIDYTMSVWARELSLKISVRVKLWLAVCFNYPGYPLFMSGLYSILLPPNMSDKRDLEKGALVNNGVYVILSICNHH
jgi:hypothetical protein